CGQRAERYRAAAQGYVDDKPREAFPPVAGRLLLPAAELMRKSQQELMDRICHWSDLDQTEVLTLLTKLQDRAEALALQYRPRQAHAKLLDLTSLATSLAMDFAYTGRLTS